MCCTYPALWKNSYKDYRKHSANCRKSRASSMHPAETDEENVFLRDANAIFNDGFYRGVTSYEKVPPGVYCGVRIHSVVSWVA